MGFEVFGVHGRQRIADAAASGPAMSGPRSQGFSAIARASTNSCCARSNLQHPQAEDLTQETFLRVVKWPATTSPLEIYDLAVHAGFATCARRPATTQASQKTEPLMPPTKRAIALDRTSDGGHTVDRQAVSTELRARGTRAIDELPKISGRSS